VSTAFGVVTVSRAYYHCAACHTGQVPWDREQGLSVLLWTPRVKALVAQTAGRMPYGEAVALLEQLVGLRIEASCAERIVAEVGGRLREAEAAVMAGYEAGELTPLVARAPGRLYVSLDGTTAHIAGAWHEVKTGVVYEGQPGPEGVDECVGQRYVAAQEPAERFGSRLYATAAAAGVEVARERVVIGDGAEWIWNVAAHHYPGATEIVDYWHACQHVHDLALRYYGEGNDQGRRWAQDHCRRLKAEGPRSLLRALRRMKPQTAAQAEAVRQERGYFTRHQQRMQYHRFRHAGLMIGSGPTEAACKVVVGARLKQSGMRWSAAGADHILAIRTRLLNRQPELIQQAARAA
jgi:hypothetical protein